MSSHRATSSAGSGGGEPALRPLPGGQSHYQLLELSPQATAAELRQAFRNLSKRYHPDTTALPQEEAREAFARLRQAYAVLADPVSRRAYDAALRQPAPPLLVVPPLPSGPAAAARPIGVRRSLSGGEWFALVLLGLALALSLVLGVGLAWARGAALVTRPSWWSEASAGSAVPVAVDSLGRDNRAPDAVGSGLMGSDAVGLGSLPSAGGRSGMAAATPLSPAVPSMPPPAGSASAPLKPLLPSGDSAPPGTIRQAP